MTWTGEGSGTDTLTFEYTVGFGGTDMDTDGVWLQTASATDNTVGVPGERGDHHRRATRPPTTPSAPGRICPPPATPAARWTTRLRRRRTRAPTRRCKQGQRSPLDGSGSSSTTSGATLTYAWTQTSGATVTLDDTTAQMPSFTAPSVRRDLEFCAGGQRRDQSQPCGQGFGGGAPAAQSHRGRPVHIPVDMIDNALDVNSIEISNITSSAFSIRGTDTTAEHDFHFCWPDGTRETLATGQMSTDTTTKTGLASATRYWWAAKAARRWQPRRLVRVG